MNKPQPIVLHFQCRPCYRNGVRIRDEIEPSQIVIGNMACPRCREKQEYINYGYGFKENTE